MCKSLTKTNLQQGAKMKATKYFLILLALVAMFTFACKTETEEVAEEVAEEVIANPIDKWIGDVKAVVETWEAKAAAGKLTDADLEAWVAAKKPLQEASMTLDLENASTEAQKPILEDLMKRMDKLDNELIPNAMAK